MIHTVHVLRQHAAAVLWSARRSLVIVRLLLQVCSGLCPIRLLRLLIPPEAWLIGSPSLALFANTVAANHTSISGLKPTLV